MIKVKHPIKAKRLEQEQLLSTIEEKHRDFCSLTLSYANASYLFYNQDSTPTIVDYKEWLEMLPENEKKSMLSIGFVECKNNISLQKYALQKLNLNMEEFIKFTMGNEDFESYIAYIYDK